MNKILYVQRVKCSSDGKIVYALSEHHMDGRLLISKDGGRSWRSADISVNGQDCKIGSFAISPDGKTMYAIRQNRSDKFKEIIVSRDYGKTFDIIKTEYVFSRIELSENGSTINALHGSNYHQSTDGGITWKETKQTYELEGDYLEFYNFYKEEFHCDCPHIKDIFARSSDNLIVYKATGTELRLPADHQSTLEKSKDGGKTWLKLDLVFDKPELTWVIGQSPDPRIEEMEAHREASENKFRLKEPLGWYSDDVRKVLDRQDLEDGGIPGVDFGNGPGRP
jgi:photosystem II stability/assembly factor-like uncharacterized protein